MAGFYGTLISSSFRVKDDALFLADPLVKLIQRRVEECEGFFEKHEGAWAFGWMDDQDPQLFDVWGDDEDAEADLGSAIQPHIVEGDVCKITVFGNEKLRYNGGVVWFVSAQWVLLFDTINSWDDRYSTSDVETMFAEFVEATEALDGTKRTPASFPPERKRRGLLMLARSTSSGGRVIFL